MGLKLDSKVTPLVQQTPPSFVGRKGREWPVLLLAAAAVLAIMAIMAKLVLLRDKRIFNRRLQGLLFMPHFSVFDLFLFTSLTIVAIKVLGRLPACRESKGRL